MSDENRELYVGQKLTAELSGGDRQEPIATWEYEITSIEPATEASGGEPVIQTTLLSENWASPEIEAINTPPSEATQSQATAEKGSDPASTALEVTKFVWEFIKDNKAVSNTEATTTSIILKDTDPLGDYQEAKNGQSSEARLIVHDSLIKSWILVDCRTRLDGTYHAHPSRQDLAHGHYMPSVHFDVTRVSVGWSFRLDASAEVAVPSNMGTANDVVPESKVYAKFKVSWLGSDTMTAAFRANGQHGFSFLGWN